VATEDDAGVAVPRCGLVIRVPHPSTLAVDKGLHLTKHEIDDY